METADMNWRKATYSNGGENCVEVAADATVHVRDSKDPGGPLLAFTAEEWAAFTGGIR